MMGYPLGWVFKIRDFFMHDFIGRLTSKRGVFKWVTPNGVRLAREMPFI